MKRETKTKLGNGSGKMSHTREEKHGMKLSSRNSANTETDT